MSKLEIQFDLGDLSLRQPGTADEVIREAKRKDDVRIKIYDGNGEALVSQDVHFEDRDKSRSVHVDALLFAKDLV